MVAHAWVSVVTVQAPVHLALAVRAMVSQCANVVVGARIVVVGRPDASARVGVARVVGAWVTVIAALFIAGNARSRRVTSADSARGIIRTEGIVSQTFNGAGRRLDEVTRVELTKLSSAPVE